MSFRLKRPGLEDMELCTILGPQWCYVSDVCDHISETVPYVTCPVQPVSILVKGSEQTS